MHERPQSSPWQNWAQFAAVQSFAHDVALHATPHSTMEHPSAHESVEHVADAFATSATANRIGRTLDRAMIAPVHSINAKMSGMSWDGVTLTTGKRYGMHATSVLR
jgi:hypothetical protein